MILLTATGNELTLEQGERLTSGSVGIYEVRFTFDAAWDGMERTAVFQTPFATQWMLLDGEGGCAVPREVLEAPAELQVAVFGTRGEARLLTTNYAALGQIVQGADSGQSSAGSAAALTYRRVLEKLERKVDRAGGVMDGPLDASGLVLGGINLLELLVKSQPDTVFAGLLRSAADGRLAGYTPGVLEGLRLVRGGEGSAFSALPRFTGADVDTAWARLAALAGEAGEACGALNWYQVQHYLLTECYVPDPRSEALSPEIYWWRDRDEAPLAQVEVQVIEIMLMACKLDEQWYGDETDEGKLTALLEQYVNGLRLRDADGKTYTATDYAGLRAALSQAIDVVNTQTLAQYLDKDAWYLELTWHELQYFLIHGVLQPDSRIDTYPWYIWPRRRETA